jgi:hypothetical protein
MEVLREETDNKGVFYVEVDGKKMAGMTYSKAGDKMIIIDHTEVDDALRGKAMVMEAVKFAREQQIKIMPLCPFANAVFKKTLEIKDVLS